MTLTLQEEQFVRRLRKFCVTYAVDVKHIMDSLAYSEPEAKP